MKFDSNKRLVSVADTLELVHNVSYKFIIVLYVFNFNCMAKSTPMLLCFLPGSLFIVKHCTCKSLVKDVSENQVKMENGD